MDEIPVKLCNNFESAKDAAIEFMEDLGSNLKAIATKLDWSTTEPCTISVVEFDEHGNPVSSQNLITLDTAPQ